MTGTTLPDAAWRRDPRLTRVFAALGAGSAMLVGGCVRDALLGVDASDIDVATVHQPLDAMRLLEAAGVKVVPTGLSHGTLTAVCDDLVVEVTTLRRDEETDGRHAVVAFTDDWREDAGRRDFTFNALYADPASGEVVDHFGGVADLAERRVRFIGDPHDRIREDHLRILRFFRFHARFGGVVDEDGLAACVARAGAMASLSVERVAAETLKLLVAPGAVGTVRLMAANGVFAPVLPEIDADGVSRLARLAGREAAYGIPTSAERRLAALLPPASALEVATRLKLSNEQRQRIAGAAAGTDGLDPFVLAYRHGVGGAVDRLLLAGADPTPVVGWAPPTLPIKGGDLVAMGLPRGPVVAATLRQVEDRWLAEGFPDAARTRQIAVGAVAAAA